MTREQGLLSSTIFTYMEGASGEGEQECWFGEKGWHECSENESGSWRDCCQRGVTSGHPHLPG